MNMDKGRKLNWKSACEMLHCSKSHFYNLINDGIIPGFRCGKVRGVWVWEHDVKKYVERSCMLIGD